MENKYGLCRSTCLHKSLRSRAGIITSGFLAFESILELVLLFSIMESMQVYVDQLFDLWVLMCRPPDPTSRRGRTKKHNSIICIWGRNHAILREKLHRVPGSRPWNHGLNGELCPEHFWKGPRIFLGSLCSASPLPPPPPAPPSAPPLAPSPPPSRPLTTS